MAPSPTGSATSQYPWTVARYSTAGAELVADISGPRPDFMLLHAGGERRSVWHPVMRELSECHHAAIALDQRGHGESTGSRGDGIREFAADVAEIIRDSEFPLIVVGASLGGFATMLALADPPMRERVAGVVLVDVVPDPDPDRVRNQLRTTTPSLDGSPLVEDILGRAEALSRACAEIAVPVLLVVAEASAITSAEVDRLARSVDRLTVHQIEGASHLVARDKPIELAKALMEFATREDVSETMRRLNERLKD